MKCVTVNTDVKYDVLIGKNLLDELPEKLSKFCDSNAKVALVTDDNVYALYGKRVESDLTAYGYKVTVIVNPHGERNKNTDTYIKVIQALASNGFTRSDVVVALGGGVTGDIGGFAAATYMRGIKYVQVPTTLLAATDSSVGGKTGVDLQEGKNLLGAFWQPSLVLCDTLVFRTLNETEKLNGLGEITKYAVLKGGILSEIIIDGINEDNIEKIVFESVKIKRDIVERDEREGGERRFLNLGHTVGHAIEKLSDYRVSHGIAVAKGINYMAELSFRKGNLTETEYRKIKALVAPFDLTTEYSASELSKAIASDKKIVDGVLNLVSIYGVGNCRIEKVNIEKLTEYLQWN